MCLENQRIIGVRGLCEEGETYKYYLDDLPGITYQNTAKTAVASKTASSLFAKAIEQGINSTMTDALYTINSPIQFNNVSNIYYHRDFSDAVQPVYAGERGLNVSMTYPTQVQFSSAIIRRVYIKTNTDVVGLVVNINVNGNIQRSETIDVLAGQEYTIELNETIRYKDFSITFDQTTVETYQASFNSDYQCCGKIINYRNGFDYLLKRSLGRFRVTGGFGVAADIDLACDEEKLMCTLLPYLGEEVRYKAGIYLANEMLVSDRLNLFTINNQEDIANLASSWSAEYQERLKRKVPQLLNSFRNTDKCCFKTLGITKSIQLI